MTAPRGQLLVLVVGLSAGLFYSLFNNRPVLYDVSYVLALALAVACTWRGWAVAVPPALRWPALAFGGVLMASSTISGDVTRSLRELPIILGYGLLFVLAGNLLARGVSRAMLFRAVVLASLVMAGAAVGVWLMDGAPLVGYRLRFETNNSAALYNLLLFPSLVTGELAALVVAPAAFVMWFGGSRGGLAATGAGLFGLVGLWPALQRWKWPLILGALAAGGVLWVYVGGLAHGGRQELWSVAWQMFTARPWLGQGPDTYQRIFELAYPTYPHYDHAHNVLLNLLAETGLLGAGAAGWLALAAGRALWKERGDKWAVGALAACAALAVQGMVDVPTTRAYVVCALLLVVRLGLRPHSPETASLEARHLARCYQVPSLKPAMGAHALQHRHIWRETPAPPAGHAETGDGAGSIAELSVGGSRKEMKE